MSASGRFEILAGARRWMPPLALLVQATLHGAAAQAAEPAEPTRAEILRERRLAAADAQVLSAPPQALVTDAEVISALDLHPSLVADIAFSGDASAAAALASLGVIAPTRGSSFLILSSGQATVPVSPEPGTDFSPGGVTGDRAVLSLTLQLPAGSSRISFDYNFLSTEYPDFIGTAFNDTFEARLTDAGGTRVVAFASVNTSRFFPASAESAGGSGFDLFTEDPSGVDTVFGTGLPDAGLTDYTAVDVSSAGGTVVLQFSIEDLGDGILDSSVILDNIVISKVEALDSNDSGFLVNGAIPNNPERLSQGGRRVVGAVADGVSRVLLRASPGGGGTVTFSILGSGFEGALYKLNGAGGGTSLTVPVVGTSQGPRAFAVYLPPQEFNQGVHEGDVERAFDFEAHYQPVSGPASVSTIPFKLVRPPVLLLHGLWSAADTWRLPLMSDARFRVFPADYSPTNAEEIAFNSEVAFLWIRTALGALRVSGIAATQVDLAAHSMGGLLARQWVAASRYLRDSNFREGDIHKLITLDTPHTGSPLADLLVLLRQGLLGPAVTAIFAKHDKPIHLGAIDDLSVCSTAQLLLGSTPVPSHALVGTGGSDVLALTPGWVGDFYSVVNFFASTVGLFQGLQHDAIVGRKSQEGGISASALSTIGGIEGLHFFNTGSTSYSNRIVQLLNANSAGSQFAQFPSPAQVCAGLGPLRAGPRPSVHASAAVPGLQITSPPSGTQVAPGEIVNVTVVPESGVSVEQVLLTGPEVALVDASAPFEFALQVPEEAAGTFGLAALGKNSADDYYSSNDVLLLVTDLPVLVDLLLVPRDARVVGEGSGLQLKVLGDFADGITREISEFITGTDYLTSDPAIAEVSADGLVTLQGSGRATLIARNSNIQDSVTLSFVTSPDDLVLANQSVSTTEQFEACNSITLGNQFEVIQPGDVSLVAGSAIILENGASFKNDATAKMILNPGVFCD